MKKIKTLSLLLGAGFIGCMLFGAKPAFAATRTWTGGGSNNNMSTAANWGGVAPSAGDDLVFPVTVSKLTVNNDMTANTSFNSITFNGAVATSGTGYTIDGNAIALVGGITEGSTNFARNTLNVPIAFTSAQTIAVTNGDTLVLGGVLSGSGNLTFNGNATFSGAVILSGNNTFTGTVTTSISLEPTTATGLGASSAGTTINSGGQVDYLFSSGSNTTATVNEPFTFNTGKFNSLGALAADADCGQGTCSDGNFTFNGAITLGANLQVQTSSTVNITGPLSGAFTTTLDSDASGTLVINSSNNTSNTPNGTSGAGVVSTTTYADNQPSQNITVTKGNTAIVTGTYGDINVLNGGILKGTGTLSDISVSAGGIIAPGMSPGCLTTGAFFESGTYQAELGGTTACSGYDQVKVVGSGGTVDVTNGTLSVSLYGGFKPAKGQTFTIIDNGGTSPVTGIFTNLAEGATFTVSGYVFKISYVGGDGNDVVLTTLSVPSTPNTGAYLPLANPLLTLVGGVSAGGALLVARRRFSRR